MQMPPRSLADLLRRKQNDNVEEETEANESSLPFPEVGVPGESSFDDEEEYEDEDYEEEEDDEEEDDAEDEDFPTPNVSKGGSLPPTLSADDLREWDEDSTPEGFKVLFDDGGDLTKITETPGKMVIPLVRARVIDAAHDESRKESLLEVFVREFDRRMISKDRKGRIEAVELIKGLADAEDDDDEAFI